MNNDYLDALVQERKRYQYLNETYSLTVQLEEAINRSDRVSVAMLISMRQEPILGMQEIDQNLNALAGRIENDERRENVLALLKGKQPSTDGDEWEKRLAAQIAQNRRLLARLLQIDQRQNQRLGMMQKRE